MQWVTFLEDCLLAALLASAVSALLFYLTLPYLTGGRPPTTLFRRISVPLVYAARLTLHKKLNGPSPSVIYGNLSMVTHPYIYGKLLL